MPTSHLPDSLLPFLSIYPFVYQYLSSIRPSRPAGRTAFSLLIFFIAPYSASIYPFVELFEEGTAVVSSVVFKTLQNPFNSMHLAAISNLGEYAVGSAVMPVIWHKRPKGSRVIPSGMRSKFFKKAKGTVYAVCRVEVPSSPGKHDWEASADVVCNGEVVATVTIEYRLDIAEGEKKDK